MVKNEASWVQYVQDNVLLYALQFGKPLHRVHNLLAAISLSCCRVVAQTFSTQSQVAMAQDIVNVGFTYVDNGSVSALCCLDLQG